MAKPAANASLWGELFKSDLYKRNQGRLVRQLTAVGLALIVAFGAWTLAQGPLQGYERGIRLGIPVVVALVGFWVVFRLVNYPRFADFLVSVQAEMDKVSWPSWAELSRATAVVIATMFFLGFILFAYDLIWVFVFSRLGVLQGS